MIKITPQNILRHEVIGLKAKLVETRNTQLVGLEGLVVDETKNTLTIDNGSKRRIVPKDISIFNLYLPDGTVVEVDGRRLSGRPEDRLKTRLRRW